MLTDRETLTDFDHQMIHVAMARGEVLVTREDRVRLATLVAWRPHRNGKRTRTARVQFPRGTFATVKIEEVSLPDGLAS